VSNSFSPETYVINVSVAGLSIIIKKAHLYRIHIKKAQQKI